MTENSNHPDPSFLTTERLKELREELKQSLGSLRETIEARLDGMDKAVLLLEAGIVRVPSLFDREISLLNDLVLAKFTQFGTTIDTRFQAMDNKVHDTVASSLGMEKTLERYFRGQFDHINTRLGMQADALAASVTSTDHKAQSANNELERLLAANTDALGAMATQRIESTSQAIVKVEQQLAIALDAAKSEVHAVDLRSGARHAASVSFIESSEAMLLNRITALQQLIDLRSELNQTAISKAETASEKRFDSVNEFRASLSDLTRQMMPRAEAEAMVLSLSDKITSNSARLDKTEGRTGATSSTMTMMVAVASVLVTLSIGGLSLYHSSAPDPSATVVNTLNSRLESLSQRLNLQENHK